MVEGQENLGKNYRFWSRIGNTIVLLVLSVDYVVGLDTRDYDWTGQVLRDKCTSQFEQGVSAVR